MLPNDVARCRGALMQEQIEEDTVRISVHSQCIDCCRRTEVMPNEMYLWADAPLGLLAEPDELCTMRIEP